MDQLVNQVAERTGITHDQARQAGETVVNFLRSRLPAPLAGRIDGLLGAANSSNLAQQAAQAFGGSGGMFGKPGGMFGKQLD
jgi:hypothetical protein